MDTSDEVMSQAQAAARFGLTRGRIHQLVKDGTLPKVELVVSGVRCSDIERYIAERRKPGRPRAVAVTPPEL